MLRCLYLWCSVHCMAAVVTLLFDTLRRPHVQTAWTARGAVLAAQTAEQNRRDAQVEHVWIHLCIWIYKQLFLRHRTLSCVYLNIQAAISTTSYFVMCFSEVPSNHLIETFCSGFHGWIMLLFCYPIILCHVFIWIYKQPCRWDDAFCLCVWTCMKICSPHDTM